MGKRDESPVIHLQPRYARILLFLTQQRHLSRDLPSEVLGWVTKKQLSEAIEELTEYAIGRDSISTYLSNITRQVEDKLGTRIEVFEYQRGRGLRLALDLSIDDRTKSDSEFSPPRQSDGTLLLPTGPDGPTFLYLRMNHRN